MNRAALSLVALLAVGAAPHDPLAGRIATGTSKCVDQIGNQALVIVDDRTLLYNPVGKRIYRNDLADRCLGLDTDDILVIDQFGSQFCENDRFRTIDRGSSIPGPWCRLGKFTAYEKPKT